MIWGNERTREKKRLDDCDDDARGAVDVRVDEVDR